MTPSHSQPESTATSGGEGSAAERVSKALDMACRYSGGISYGDGPNAEHLSWGDIRDVIDQRAELLEAAQTVLAGLLERIDNAPSTAVPVFAGVADLYSAIAKATRHD